MRERAATQIVVAGDDEGAGALAGGFEFGDQLGKRPTAGGQDGFWGLEAQLARFEHGLAQRVVLAGPVSGVRRLAGVGQRVFQPAHHAEFGYVDVLEAFGGGPAASGFAVFELLRREAVHGAEQRFARLIQILQEKSTFGGRHGSGSLVEVLRKYFVAAVQSVDV